MSESLVQELRSHWQLLRTLTSESGTKPVRLLSSKPGLENVWAGISAGFPALLVQLDENVDEQKLPEGIQGRIRYSRIVQEYRNQTIHLLEIICLDQHLEQVFAEFCRIMLQRLLQDEKPVAALTSAIKDFQNLLGAGLGPKGTSPVATGLLGELLILRELVRHDPGLFATWTGAEGARHDFRFGSRGLEIKTRLRAQVDSVTIASIDQLEPPPGGMLHLITISIERDIKGSISLNGLLQDIRSCLKPTDLDSMDRRVSAMITADPEADTRYSVLEVQAFVVSEQFPALTTARLSAGKLDPGVSHVRYQLDVSALGSHHAAHGSFVQLLTGVPNAA